MARESRRYKKVSEENIFVVIKIIYDSLIIVFLCYLTSKLVLAEMATFYFFIINVSAVMYIIIILNKY